MSKDSTLEKDIKKARADFTKGNFNGPFSGEEFIEHLKSL